MLVSTDVDFQTKWPRPSSKKGSRGFGWRPASTRGFRVPLQGASVRTELWSSGEYLRGGRVHRPKAPDETGRRVLFYVALGLVTAATLMLQIIETRIISVTSWYHLAFFVI